MRQIGEVFTYLHGSKHSFIYKVSTGKRHNIEIFMMYSFLYLLADDIECTFQLQVVRISRNKNLFDIRFGTQSIFSQTTRIDRHITQMH